MYATDMYSQLSKSLLRYKFLILETYQPNNLYYMSKDLRSHGYFLRSKGVHEQKSLGNTVSHNIIIQFLVTECFVIPHFVFWWNWYTHQGKK